MNEDNSYVNITLAFLTAGVIAILIALGVIYFQNNKDGEIKSNDVSSQSNTSTTSTTSVAPSDKNQNGCYTPSTVRNHYGETACVEFLATYTYETNAGTKFIDEKRDYKNGFAVYIPKGSTFSSVSLSQFDNKSIQATGLIRNFEGSPQITATEYSQVKILRN